MQGRRDVPLSPAGRAEIATWRLPPDEAPPLEWVASPLARAVETARCLSGAAPRLAPKLIEMDWGAWEGRRLADLASELGDEFTRNESRGLDFRPPGGESPREVMGRVGDWLLAQAAHGDRHIVAVTHNGVLRAVHALATGWDMTGKPPHKLRPATLHRFAVESPSARPLSPTQQGVHTGCLARGARLTLVACNVPLAPLSAQSRAAAPRAPPAAPR